MTLRNVERRERRRHPRAIAEFAAVLTAGGRSYRARLVNLSMGGALLDVGAVAPDPAINVGDPVSVAITYGGGFVGPLNLEAKVVLWNTKTRKVPLLAIQFQEVAEADSDVLEELMLNALAQIRERAAARTMPR